MKYSPDYFSKLEYSGELGSIKLVKKEYSRNIRKKFSHDIIFTSKNGTEINFGFRKSTTYAFIQLMENFGNYTELKQLENPEKTYSANTFGKDVIPQLKKILANTEFEIKRNISAAERKVEYKIYYKNLSPAIVDNNNEM